MESKLNGLLCELRTLVDIQFAEEEKNELTLALMMKKLNEIDELLGYNYEIYKLEVSENDN